ncbi:DNA internalization-related competence protein ComEC/Rec2 [Variovorax sp. J2P1-59]|uniref:DNA internalization-related competence protein ComEC/Rec2 n=1 Tax=Variovorax flavidus TaxID=3053501 RepID=UPI002575D436|nr:DNA internalization-related competence protein ComEC/Rec2 [Variovorax sp. J2P1-59]MDM0076295.1 DNA internalization-related competence protein ComEC/Rec2 [Variovorax sp. J2P1-59]
MPGGKARGLTVFAAMAGSVLGAALQVQQPVLWNWVAYAGLTTGALAAWLALLSSRRLGRGLLPMALLLGAIGGAGLAGWRATAYAGGALPPALEGRDVQVVGVVAQMPQRGDGMVRFVFEVESADLPNVPGRISLGWYAEGSGLWGRAGGGDPPGSVHAGERWRMTVRLRAPHGHLNPHGFDQELRLWEQGVHATGYVRTGARDPRPERIAVTFHHPIERLREAVRDAVFERVTDPRPAGVIAALVTGDQNAIERADWDVFRATGVAHLMAISGLHITMFAWLAALAVETLWRRSGSLMLRWPAQHAGLVGGVLLATLYAAFSGWGLPSQRTVWMLGAVALLRLTGRRWPWPHVWLCACAVVVALDPWAMLQPGFWLSFVAVGVLFAADAREPQGDRSGVASRLVRVWREQWVVTLALTPLTLLLFQQISAIGMLANVVAIPWVTVVVTPLAMLGAVLPLLWDVAAWTVQVLSLLLQWLARLPFATLSMPAPPLWMAVAGVAGGVLLAMRLPWSMRVLGLPMLLPALLWQAPRPSTGEFELLAADIGQGNAVLVRTATHSLLYDAGPRYSLESDAGQRVLVPLLRAFGERLDTVVLSHRDSDHTGGASAVLTMQPQAELLSSIEAGHPLQALRTARRCETGQRWTWDGVVFEVLQPAASDYRTFTKPNAISCVLRITNGRASALLAGDIERLQEAALVARTPDLRADLLLVPHHGSKTSSSDLLLDAVRPRVALVQAGYRNRFGHPAPEVVGRYVERGIALTDTPHCGAASWSSMAPGTVGCLRQQARRYWHHEMPQLSGGIWP